MKTVSTAQMKSIDEFAIHRLGIPSLELMEHAAAHVAAAVKKLLPNTSAPVVLLCGTGNNGGDGLACARILAGFGYPVHPFIVGDPARFTPDAAENAHKLELLGLPPLPCPESLPDCGCIVDALFGFGLNREVRGVYRSAIELMNAAPAPVIACDIPSGLNGDTGSPMGIAVEAAQTITFTCAKTGLLMPEAASYVGQLTVVDIGIPAELVK